MVSEEDQGRSCSTIRDHSTTTTTTIIIIITTTTATIIIIITTTATTTRMRSLYDERPLRYKVFAVVKGGINQY
jgi:hypothetical protein